MITADWNTGALNAVPAVIDAGSANPWDSVSFGANCAVNYYPDAHSGKFSCHFKSAAAGGAYTSFLTWNSATLGTTTTAHFGYIYIKPFVNLNGDRIVRMFGPAGASACHIVVWTDNTIRFRDSTLTDRATGTVPLVNGSWNRIEWSVIHSATVGQFEFKAFVGANYDGLIADETKTSTAAWNTSTALNQLDFGLGDNDPSMDFLLGPIGSLAVAYAGPKVIAKPHILVPARMKAR